VIAPVDGTFDVIGAAQALAYFGASAESGLSHGYLFSGPAGVGKKTFARRLAQSLFCQAPKSRLLGYDDTCPACKSFRAGSYPDYYESTGTIAIGDRDSTGSAHADDPSDNGHTWTHAESVRDKERMESRGLIRELALRPYAGRWRVVVLGDVEFASAEAANALLKFFEEPPPFVLIALTTDAPHSLLATMRSRLIEIPFAPLPGTEVVRILERDGVPSEEARFAAASAMGSVTRARAILEGAEAGLREAAMAWLEDVLAGRAPDTSFLDRVTKAAEKRKVAGELLEFVRVIARDWAALAVAGRSAPLLAGDLRKRVDKLPKRRAEDVVAALAAIADTQRLANTNVTPHLVLDYLRMQLTPQREA
jgi:DNA polymerase III subunit delta'